MGLFKKLYPLGFQKDCIELLKIAIPIFLSNFSGVLLTVSGIFFCGHLGQEALAAISLASLVSLLFSYFALRFLLFIFAATDY